MRIKAPVILSSIKHYEMLMMWSAPVGDVRGAHLIRVIEIPDSDNVLMNDLQTFLQRATPKDGALQEHFPVFYDRHQKLNGPVGVDALFFPILKEQV